LEENKNKSIVCLLPFYAIYFSGRHGKMGSCCLQKPLTSSLKKDSIASFWKSEEQQKIRKMFIKGEWPDSCSICKKQEQSGVLSYRQQWNDNFMTRIGATEEDIDIEYGNPYKEPIYLDYRPDNMCNLSCTMCNPDNANKIEKMAKDLDLNLWDLSGEDADYNAEEFIKTISKNTRRIKLNGGEPTISKKIHKIFDYLIHKGYSKNIELQFTTNFTNYNKTFELLKEFKTVRVSASLDGTSDTYEYIRSPAKWKKITENILKFVQDRKHFDNRFAVNSVWFSATAFTIKDWVPELLDFIDENFEEKILIHMNQCQKPAWQNLSIIPNEFRSEIYKDIEDLKLKYPKYLKMFQAMKFGLDNYAFNKDNLKIWQDITPKTDAYRKTDITKLHPRFKDLMDYNV